MDISAVTREQILASLRDSLYEVVPLKYQTYCALTGQICCRVLRHFGIEAQLVPCQLWWVTPEQNFVVGFYRKASATQWEGHVVCMGDGFLIDAALYHVQKQLGVEVPKVVVGSVFGIPSTVISRYNLSHDAQLWWHRPPPGIDVTIPDEPEELIAMYANELISRLELGLGFEASLAARLVPAQWQPVP